MPISVAFTFTAILAGLANLWFLWRAISQRRNLKASGQNGQLARIAVAFVQVWSLILLADVLMLVAGIGILTGFRPAGYMLAVVPLMSLLVGISALRGFD